METAAVASYFCVSCLLLEGNVYLLVRQIPRTAKIQKSYAVYKMIKAARLNQKCFKASILYNGKLQVSLVQELRSRSTFGQRQAGLIILYTAA